MVCLKLFGPNHKKYKFIAQCTIAGLSIVGGITLLTLGLTVPLGSALIAGGIALLVPFSISPFTKQENEEIKEEIKELHNEIDEINKN